MEEADKEVYESERQWRKERKDWKEIDGGYLWVGKTLDEREKEVCEREKERKDWNDFRRRVSNWDEIEGAKYTTTTS